jgi:hypothetical protein
VCRRPSRGEQERPEQMRCPARGRAARQGESVDLLGVVRPRSVLVTPQRTARRPPPNGIQIRIAAGSRKVGEEGLSSAKRAFAQRGSGAAKSDHGARPLVLVGARGRSAPTDPRPAPARR